MSKSNYYQISLITNHIHMSFLLKNREIYLSCKTLFLKWSIIIVFEKIINIIISLILLIIYINYCLQNKYSFNNCFDDCKNK